MFKDTINVIVWSGEFFLLTVKVTFMFLCNSNCQLFRIRIDF